MQTFEEGFVLGLAAAQKKEEEPTPPAPINPDGWEYPPNWLVIPDPAENQVKMLVENRDSDLNPCRLITLEVHFGDWSEENGSAGSIDWGDSQVTSGTGSSGYKHKYPSSAGVKQYIITINFTNTAGDMFVSNYYTFPDEVGATVCKMLCRAIKFGHNKLLNDNGATELNHVQYLKMCRGETYGKGWRIGKGFLRRAELSKSITAIANSAFAYCNSLTDVNLTNINTVGEYAFRQCYNLHFNNQSQKMSNLSSIGKGAFYDSGIITFDTACFPKVTALPINCFQNCNLLTEISHDSITSLSGGNNNNTFAGCKSLMKINLPNLSSISGSRTITDCYCLTYLNFPSCNNITGSNVIRNCNCLKKIIVSANATISEGAIDSVIDDDLIQRGES